MFSKFVLLRLQGVRDPFMSMANGKSSAPPAPDYTGAATATAAGNLDAARATAAANRTNQVTPYGNLTYSANPGTDAYGNTLYTATQTLSPAEQGLLNQTNQLNTGLMSTANQGLNYANQVLSQPGVDTSKLTQMQGGTGNQATGMQSQISGQGVPSLQSNVNNPNVQTGLDTSGIPTLQSSVSPYGNISNSIDTSGLPSTGFNPGQSYQDAIMSRLSPQIARENQSSDAQLANQGIAQGTEAYNNAKTLLGQNQNDRLTSATTQGLNMGLAANQQQFGQNAAQQQAQNAAQAQGFGQNTAQASLANQANQQAYNQSLNNAQFGNQAAGQQYQQNIGNAQLANQANQQQFGQNTAQASLANQINQQQYNQQLQNAQLGNAANQQGFQQAAYNQMQPINVINALRTGSQVTNPSYASTPQQANTAGPDILGATNASYTNQLNATNAQNAQSGNFMGGLMGLGSAALMSPVGTFSDENLKTDIKRIGTHDLGMGIYTYHYKDGYNLPTGLQVGVMAQEVEKVIPEAVIVTDSGFKAVNYAML